MRVLLPLLLMILGIGFIGFLVTNPDQRVTVHVWNTPFPDVALSLVVFLSLAVGAAFIAVVALVEGASIRLQNRKLRRELRRLETELNLQRTRLTDPPRPEPDALDEDDGAANTSANEEPGRRPPSAPVYGREAGDDESDPDDDAYSGGRAV